MKAGLATSLSIAGVLATGGAALVLNSSILDTSSTAKGTPALATVVGLNDQSGVAALGNENAQGAVTASGLADVVNGIEDPLSVDNPTPGRVAASDANVVADASTTTTTTARDGARGVEQKQVGVAVDESTTTLIGQSSPTSTPPETATVDKQFSIAGVATVTLTATNGKLSVKSIAIVAGSGYRVARQYSHDGDDIRITFTSATRTIEFSARMLNGNIVAAIGNPGNGNLTPPQRPGDADRERHEREEHEDHEDHEEHEREGDDD